MFDIEKFTATNFTRRTAEVPIIDPDLKEFFPEDASAVWIVQSLTGEECARANDAKRTNRNIAEIISKIAAASASGTDAQKLADEAGKLLGVTKTTLPDDHVYRLDLLVYGSKEPKIKKRDAVLLAERKPHIFYALTNRIIELIGDGMAPD